MAMKRYEIKPNGLDVKGKDGVGLVGLVGLYLAWLRINGGGGGNRTLKDRNFNLLAVRAL